MPKTEKYTLDTPIQFGEEQITELEIRKPNGSDFRQFSGSPYTPNADGGIDVDWKVMVPMIARLSGRPPSQIDMLETSDLWATASIVVGFISPSGTNPTNTSSSAMTSPASGELAPASS